MLNSVLSILPGLLAALALVLVPAAANACTRVVYLGANNDVITARSMDWKVDVQTNPYVFRVA